MNLKELILKTPFENVAKKFEEHYKDYKHITARLELLYSHLKQMQPADTREHTLYVEEYVEEGEKFYDVFAICDEVHYSYSMAPRKEWLSLEVANNSMPEAEFLAHVLWDMTFFGLTDEDINKHFEEERIALIESFEEPHELDS